MKRLFILISALSFLLLAPAVQQQIYGVETSSQTTVVQQNNVVSDESINRAVKAAIASDVELAKFINNINVSVDKGVVTLSGVVNSSDAKSNIEDKVESIMGVKDVVNDIEVQEAHSE